MPELVTESNDSWKNKTYLLEGKEVSIDVLHRIASVYGYEEPVVDIDQFIDDPYYLGKVLGGGLYPIWRKAARKLFPTPYHSPYGEVVLSGAIGLGKSTMALLITFYDIHKMLSLRNPNQHYKLIDSTVIKFALMNATKHLAYGVLWSQFEDWVNASPYFKSKVNLTKNGRKGKTYFIKNVDVGSGSRGSDFLGTATAGAIFSEINDMTVVSGQAEDNLDTIAIRRESRFAPANKEIIGHLILDSSNKGNRSFIDARLEDKQKRGIKDYIVFSFSQWEAKWHLGRYSGEFFKVYAGDEYLDPFIVDETNEYRLAKVNQSRIINVPIEHKESFVFNIVKALRDLAGVSTYSSFSFIPSTEILNNTFIQPQVVSKDEIMLDFYDKDQIIDQFIDISLLKFLNKSPRFIHIDLGITKDSSGMACTYFDGFIDVTREDPVRGSVVTTREPKFVTEWVMEIKATPGQEVPIYKIKNFILSCISMGYPIARVSTDGYQSTNLRQDLKLSNVEADLISVDRTKDPYNNLRNTILEGRTKLPMVSKLRKEIEQLEENDQKFDHPPDGCFTGDTEICLVHKESKKLIFKSFENLLSNDYTKDYYAVSSSNGGNIVLSEFRNPRITGKTNTLIKIVFDDGYTVKCTPDHKFLTGNNRSNHYTEAKDLVVNQSVANARKIKYTKIEKISKIRLKKPELVYDLTVPEYENFALKNGNIVHNSKDILDAVCGSTWNCSQHISDSMRVEQIKDLSAALDNIHSSTPTIKQFENKLKKRF